MLYTLLGIYKYKLLLYSWSCKLSQLFSVCLNWHTCILLFSTSKMLLLYWTNCLVFKKKIESILLVMEKAVIN